jgi:hypothetical protein
MKSYNDFIDASLDIFDWLGKVGFERLYLMARLNKIGPARTAHSYADMAKQLKKEFNIDVLSKAFSESVKVTGKVAYRFTERAP